MSDRPNLAGQPIPAKTGIGLRAPHMAEIMARRPAVGWLEVHAENYMGQGPAFRALQRLRPDYPISLHGVGLSLGGTDGIDEAHLARLKRLADCLDPFLISEHLSWSDIGGVYLNGLMPLPYSEETLDLVVEHVDFVQARLGRRILVENPSAYLRFRHSPIPEAEFLAALVARSGCGLLCDINNIYVSGRNLGFDPIEYLAALPAAAIGEFHLAGHQANPVGDSVVLIDDHGSAVADAVWALHGEALRRIGRRPTLVEWDSRLPALDLLMAEAEKADRLSKTLTPETGDVQAA
jgi:uncharacterized protein (UPF0276 family)